MGQCKPSRGPCVCSHTWQPLKHTWGPAGSAGPCASSWNLEGLWEERDTSVTFRERPQNVHLRSLPVASGSSLVPSASALCSWRIQSSPNNRLAPPQRVGVYMHKFGDSDTILKRMLIEKVLIIKMKLKGSKFFIITHVSCRSYCLIILCAHTIKCTFLNFCFI